MNDTVFFIIAGVFGAIIVFALVYFITSSSKKKKLGVIGMVNDSKGLTQGKLTEFLPNFDNNKFSKNVFRTYIDIEQALNTLNLEGIRNMISPELFKQYEGQITFFKNQGKSLIRQDFTHYYTKIIGITRQNGEVIANVLLGLEFKEYFLDSANQVIGNNQFPISKEINLLLSVKNNTRAVMSCTHCGALVTSRVNPKCGYCENPIVSYDYEFTVLKERSRTIRKPKFFNN